MFLLLALCTAKVFERIKYFWIYLRLSHSSVLQNNLPRSLLNEFFIQQTISTDSTLYPAHVVPHRHYYESTRRVFRETFTKIVTQRFYEIPANFPLASIHFVASLATLHVLDEFFYFLAEKKKKLTNVYSLTGSGGVGPTRANGNRA